MHIGFASVLAIILKVHHDLDCLDELALQILWHLVVVVEYEVGGGMLYLGVFEVDDIALEEI